MSDRSPDVAIQTAAATRYKPRSILDRLRSHPAGSVTLVFPIVLALCIGVSLLWPEHFRFATVQNLTILQRAIPTVGITALGVGLLMIAGEFDLSVGAVFGLSSYVMVLLFSWGYPIVLGVAAGLVIAVAIGLINGWITVHYGIPSFITTLGTLFIFRFGARLVSSNKPLMFSPPDWLYELTAGRLWFGVQAQFVWFLALAVAAWVLLNRHTLGSHFFSVGGNPAAAKAVGIDVGRTKIMAFIWCSVMAAIAGMLSVTRVRLASSDPQTFMELNAIAACVMGGVALTGGRGAVLGIVVGAVTFHLIQDVLLLAQAPGYYLDLFVGIVIVFGVTLNQAVKKRY
jgi:simple sugar transport system permease protein